MAKRFLKTTVVSVIFALTLAVSASAATAGGATTTTAVNFRTGAGTNYGIISTLPAGTHVVVSERSSGNWATVVYNGTVGYISSDYLKRANDMDASFGTGTICGSYVRMRSSASTSSSILGTYNSGTTMTVTGVSGAWYKVDYNGTDGYVYSNYLSLSGVTSSGGSASGSNGSVKGSDVRMRSGPGTNYSILGVYNTGTEMTITGESGNWYKVSYGGKDGYVSKDYMTTTKPSSGGSTSQTGYIKGNDVRLRSGAGTSYSILGTYNNGTPLTITGTSGDWTAVTINGVKGYVNSAYVSTTKTEGGNGGGSTPSTSIGETIVATAKQYMGAPYVYGGMSPSGFDCSGFVNYVYKLCGYSMSRVASSIYNNNGTYVEKANLQIGDLVFFASNSSSIGHVGIYIGNGQFIHSSSGAGCVVISDLSSSYYLKNYVGAKRIAG